MPVRASPDILQRRYCFRTLPLIYHPRGKNEDSYNSEIPENHIFFFEGKHSERQSFTSDA